MSDKARANKPEPWMRELARTIADYAKFHMSTPASLVEEFIVEAHAAHCTFAEPAAASAQGNRKISLIVPLADLDRISELATKYTNRVAHADNWTPARLNWLHGTLQEFGLELMGKQPEQPEQPEAK